MLDNFLFPKSAVFYTEEGEGFLSEADIRSAFNDASHGKYGKLYDDKFLIQERIAGDENIRYSFRAFKRRMKPTCFDAQPNSIWMEVKFAYVLIVEYDGYVAINRKYVPQLKRLMPRLREIDYQKMVSAFITDKTQYQRISTKNLDMSATAIRSKSLEAVDLKDAFSTTGANNFVLNQCRMSNDDGVLSLSLNSSRVNRLGSKDDFNSYLGWVKQVVGCFRNCVARQSLLTSFAESVDYESVHNQLRPTTILFHANELLTDFDNEIYTRAVLKTEVAERSLPFPVQKLLSALSQSFEIEYRGNNYVIIGGNRRPVILKMLKNKVKLQSDKYATIHLVKADGESVSLLDYINGNSPFVLFFDQYEYRYTNRRLFKDNGLLGNLAPFLSVFETDHSQKIADITSEKGRFIAGQNTFDGDSEFDFVEATYKGEYDYFLCDDLGKEWADHIGITDNRISFFLSKHDTSQFSASSFHDVVGQALKNIGNMKPDTAVLGARHDDWDKTYNQAGVNTQIHRLRKGTTVVSAIDCWKQAMLNPNLRQDMYLIVNFIAKGHLASNLRRMQNGEQFGERKQTVQILWLISSLISQCHEQGIAVHIVCKN